mmetsp:Transcript_33265/g.58373  ORF Transcript_33265/g.58373 Transcript_33265/m.58373 type:complete len:245 (+) Transcript_33265:249-983(+)
MSVMEEDPGNLVCKIESLHEEVASMEAKQYEFKFDIDELRKQSAQHLIILEASMTEQINALKGAVEAVSLNIYERVRMRMELKDSELTLKRLDGVSKWHTKGPPNVDAFTLNTNEDIWLTGLGCGAACTDEESITILSIEIRLGNSTRGQVLYRHPKTVTTVYKGNMFPKIEFAEPILLMKNTDYCIKVCYGDCTFVWSGSGYVKNILEGVIFQFNSANFAGEDIDNGSSASHGPVRDIYFAIA